MLGDINIAEPKALIGFAGPRVIEQTIREKLPKNFQRSEFLLEHGMIDAVVDRREMRDTLIRLLRFLYNPEVVRTELPAELRAPEDGRPRLPLPTAAHAPHDGNGSGPSAEPEPSDSKIKA